MLIYLKHLKNVDVGGTELLTSKDLFTNDGHIIPKHLLSLTNAYIVMKFVILMPIVVFFLREPSIAHNINGIGITNSKYIYIYI